MSRPRERSRAPIDWSTFPDFGLSRDRWRDVPTLRLDDVGRAAAANTIARERAKKATPKTHGE